MSFFRRSPPRAQTTPSSQRHVLKGRRARRGSALRATPALVNTTRSVYNLQAAQCGSTVNRSSPFVRYSRLFSHSQELLNTHEDFLSRLSPYSKPPGPGTVCLPPYQPLLESRPQLPRVPRVTVSPIRCARKGRRPSQDAPNRTRGSAPAPEPCLMMPLLLDGKVRDFVAAASNARVSSRAEGMRIVQQRCFGRERRSHLEAPYLWGGRRGEHLHATVSSRSPIPRADEVAAATTPMSVKTASVKTTAAQHSAV